MAIQASDIKIYLSGGAENTSPNDSIGGAKSGTLLVDNALSNLFDKIKAAEATAGSTKYRAVYIQNNHATLTWEDIKVYILQQTTSPKTKIEVGVADEGKNETIELLANETTAPESVVFNDSTTPGSGLDIPNLEANDYIGIWVKRVVTAGALAIGEDTGKIGYLGETTDE